VIVLMKRSPLPEKMLRGMALMMRRYTFTQRKAKVYPSSLGSHRGPSLHGLGPQGTPLSFGHSKGGAQGIGLNVVGPN